MSRKHLMRDVFSAAYERTLWVYKNENFRPIVAFSGGKDSGIVLELAIMAARETGRLPIDVSFCDEEALFPGTEEYLLRTASRDEVRFHWHLLTYPQVNIFNRQEPFWWLFDDRLSPDKWVRKFPKWAKWVPEVEIANVVNYYNFPVEKGQKLATLLGIRCAESRGRMMGMYSSKSFHTGGKGVKNVWPIYDWKANDVWKAVKEFGWDYNHVYDDWTRMKVKANEQKVAPPTMVVASLKMLRPAAILWPRWFDKLCERCPGVREGVKYGSAFLNPHKREDETWEQAYHRLILGPTAPEWIRERGQKFKEIVLKRHYKHSASPLPQIYGCPACQPNFSSWFKMTVAMYLGDPFCYKQRVLPLVEPEYFRPGFGTWKDGISFDRMPKWVKDLDTYDETIANMNIRLADGNKKKRRKEAI